MTREQWLNSLTIKELKEVRAAIIVAEATATGLYERVNDEITRRENYEYVG